MREVSLMDPFSCSFSRQPSIQRVSGHPRPRPDRTLGSRLLGGRVKELIRLIARLLFAVMAGIDKDGFPVG